MTALTAELQAVVDSLETTRWSYMVCDERWHLVWVSREHRALLDAPDDESLGIGHHILVALQTEVWQRSLTEASMRERIAEALPFIAATSDPVELDAILGSGTAARLPASTHLIDVSAGTFDWRSPAGLPPAPVAMISFHLRRPDGSILGTVVVFGSPLRPVVNDLLVRGDEATLERMASFIVPRRVSTAILFADVQESSALARRLSHTDYFTLVRELMTALDAVVVDHQGLVSKHAGDGVTAFFPVMDGRDRRAAARAGVCAAREMQAAACAVVNGVGAELGVRAGECLLNVGVHWSDHVTLGQLVTGGRLEVTALGSAVNECARIQETARDGALLISRRLVTEVAHRDRGPLGLSLPAGDWRQLRLLPTVTDKARRDAGSVVVCDIREVAGTGWGGASAA